MLLVPLLAMTLFVFALVDIILRPGDEVRHLPKLAWVFIVILLPLIGSVLWFAVGREYAPRPDGAGRAGRTARTSRPSRPAHPNTVVVRESPGDRIQHGRPLTTEEQLAAVDREIEFHQRQERIRQLEEEVRRRRDAPGGTRG